MKIYNQEVIYENLLQKIICDCCKKEYDQQNFFEIEEFISIDKFGGYGSVFEDGTRIKLDLCQYCFKELLGKYCQIRPYSIKTES
jgi:hypothetical protein